MFTLKIKWTMSNAHFHYFTPSIPTPQDWRFAFTLSNCATLLSKPCAEIARRCRCIIRLFFCTFILSQRGHCINYEWALLLYGFLHSLFVHSTWRYKASALANKSRIAISTDASKKIIIMQIGQNNRNGIHYLLGIPWFKLSYEANKIIPFPMPPNYAYGSFMF